MYINNTNILIYTIFGIIGLLVGQFISLCNDKLPKHKDILTKENLKYYIKPENYNYRLMIINAVIYIALVYKFGFEKDTIIDLLKFSILTPFLISAFYIDSKLQILPNRLTLTIFEIGIICAFLLGITNIYSGIEMLLGMVVGAGIFFIITIIGGWIFGKETMGYGDIKIMGALGLFFGWRGIIAISILSFLIGALYSIILIIISKVKKEKREEYIAFGPFIVLASFIVMFVPLEILISIPFELFTLGKFNG